VFRETQSTSAKLTVMDFHTASFEAIGVSNQVTVLDPDALPAAVALARAEVVALDDACSRFRGDSELARLNAVGQGTVSPLLLEAIETALEAAQVTGGLVDPTVGASMRALGYDRDFAVVVRRGAKRPFELRPASRWRSVELDRATSTVRLARGTELDLGATAKAFASDRIAALVHRATGSPTLISLGGDIAVAGAAPAGGWPILVTEDSRGTGVDGPVVAIATGGLATSSTTVRRWRAGETVVHHIVEPATGAPASERWRTVTVAAPTCLEANVAATAAIVAGPSAAHWLESRGHAARLVSADGALTTTGGWPPDQVATGEARAA
jgi:thiamine biosynthesis lipoprotein